MEPAYEDEWVALYHASHADLPDLGADLAIVDPPYGDTSLPWDKLATDWLDTMERVLAPNGSVWLWGSLRSLVVMLAAADQRGWKQAQDVVWEKHNGTNMSNDRFRRVHEHVVHLYRGEWCEVFSDPQRSLDATKRAVRRKQRPSHWGEIGEGAYASEDGGPRLMRSVQYERSAHGHAIHPTQKPLGVTMTLIKQSCPLGGVVVSPYAGSGTDLLAARMTQRLAVGTELDAGYLAKTVERLAT